MKIDKRKKMFMVLDTETTNNTIGKPYNDGLAYDLGIAIVDKKGNEYFSKSWVITDIFDNEKELMDTAYYHEKLPKYYEELENGTRERISIFQAKRQVRELIEKYNVKMVLAYNMQFDLQVLNNTLRYVSKSKIRYFFPFGVELGCIWNMACHVLTTQKRFLKENKLNEKGNYITKAERVYQYITNNDQFEEEHTGLCDVRIETEIMAKCFQQHKKMETNIFHNAWRIPNKAKKDLLTQ